MSEQFEMIAKTFQGLEEILAEELTALGANDIQIGRRMVSFTGDKRMMYKANFCLRTAIRILKPIKNFTAKDAFLFCCYAGLRYSDFTNLSPENIVKMHQETWLIYKSVKTNTEVRLPLYLLFEGKGIEVLNKYHRNALHDWSALRPSELNSYF